MTTPPVARYQQVAARLRDAILSGEYGPGQLLPSEAELAEQYGLARPTINKAVRLLVSEGLVTVEHGRGSFVRPTPHVRLLISGANYRRHRDAGLPGFNAQVLEQGQTPRQALREVATTQAPTDVAVRLNLTKDDRVVVRRRTFLIDDQPIATCDSYYPADLAEGTAIALPHKIKGGVHAVIEDETGPIARRIVRSVDDLVCRMPTIHETEAFQLPPGVPVVRILRTIYDAEDLPIEVQDSVAAADRHAFRYEVQMR